MSPKVSQNGNNFINLNFFVYFCIVRVIYYKKTIGVSVP